MDDKWTMDSEFTLEQGRKIINLIARHGNEYAGIPLPLDGEELIVHPSYKFAHLFRPKPEDPEHSLEVVNAWWSSRRGWEWIIFRKNGKLHWAVNKRVRHAELQLHTLGVSQAWTLEAETIAIMKLGSLIKPHAMHQYALTGSFLERSERSKVVYMFRRLRPTLALSTSTGTTIILCALCLHPIGYYKDTWAGVLCPTDEVIAHLMLMRGDEHGFWKQANQHPAYRPEAGI